MDGLFRLDFRAADTLSEELSNVWNCRKVRNG
jgi:hypothetical protein